MIRLPERIICRNNIVNQVFGEGPLDLDQQNRLNNAILCPTNRDSLEINEVILDRFLGENHEYLSTTNIINRETGIVDDVDDYPIEEALRATPNGFPPHCLNIKVGAIVMLLKNWSVAFGLCNGTRLRVTQCNQQSIRCSVLTGPQQGNEFVLPRTEFRSNQNDAGVWLRRIQYPFRLSFAMTINKSQGQTFNNVGLLLRQPVFSHGQLYVAASRVRNFDSFCILVDTHLVGSNRQGVLRITRNDNGIYTKNVVFRELLN